MDWFSKLIKQIHSWIFYGKYVILLSLTKAIRSANLKYIN